ncbi:hypothetical protein T484DRAFT_1943385 [Baffinella frigidus]|nr:hypothetical protein T484DRAFT_1943385 [Cryptophyta sp. CCMP2293]
MVQVAPADAADIQLLKDEEASMGLMMEEGIATISFYKGEFKPAAEALRAQFALVVASNAWLAGHLVKTKAGVHLRHPVSPSATEIDSLFTATSAEDTAAFKLTPTSPYTKICTDMYKSKVVIVGSGNSILGKNQPVALLTLSESAPREFALIFSISHAVADGRCCNRVLSCGNYHLRESCRFRRPCGTSADGRSWSGRIASRLSACTLARCFRRCWGTV